MAVGRTRGKGEGSVYRRSDGRWVGAVELPRRLDGRRRRARVVRKRKTDVLVALDELKRQAADGVIPDKTTTVEAVLTFWLDDVAANQVSASSLTEYRKRVDRLVPLIGHVKLARLNVPHCQAAAAELQRHYAPKTARTTVETLRAALRWAVAAGMMPRNPAEHVMLTRAPAAKIDDALTAPEAKAILQVAEGDELESMWWLAIKYGLRLSELLDLKWKAVDLDNGELHVVKSKTDAGVRTLPLIADAEAQLRANSNEQVRGPTSSPTQPGADTGPSTHGPSGTVSSPKLASSTDAGTVTPNGSVRALSVGSTPAGTPQQPSSWRPVSLSKSCPPSSATRRSG